LPGSETGNQDDCPTIVIPVTEQEKIDVAFRVIADHLRTLSFSIADGIQPGNSDRNYTLRRILRRAVKYGRTLEFKEPFFYKLVDVLAAQMADVFPELRVKKEQIKNVLKIEEEAFNRTLDRGLLLFEVVATRWEKHRVELPLVRHYLEQLASMMNSSSNESSQGTQIIKSTAEQLHIHAYKLHQPLPVFKIEQDEELAIKACKTSTDIQNHLGKDSGFDSEELTKFRRRIQECIECLNTAELVEPIISGDFAFKLYDEQGFPLDLTELLARERGLNVDAAGFDKLMEEQKRRAREAGQKNKQVVSVSEIETKDATQFVGYDALETDAKVLEVVSMKDKTAVVLDSSVCYAEMGGQIGDSGQIILGADAFPISSTTKVGNTWLHFIEGEEAPAVGSQVRVAVDAARRHAIERHHTVTHILHWALHEVVSQDATQKGSNVTPDKLTFDFNSAALTAAQLADIEKLVNERIVANDVVSWTEVPYTEAKANSGIMQLFGEKYPENVRVVQIGGKAHALDGWSMELCGGTHTRHTGEIGLFRLVAEGAVAAGVRRIEAIAGLEAYNAAKADADLLKLLAGKVSAQGASDLEKKIEALLDHQKALEKALKAAQQREASGRAKELITTAENHVIIANLGEVDADYAMALNDALKGQFGGIVVLAATGGGNVTLMATVDKEHQVKVQAGKIIQAIAPIVGGKGGGKPDFARGGGKEVSKVEAALAEARRLIC
jgi:alanyl-tRNA synthetase